MRKSIITIVALLLLFSPSQAQSTSKERHHQLLKRYCPDALWSDKVVETSWQQLRHYPRMQEIWTRLAASSHDLEGALEKCPDVTLKLDTRTYYLAWLYGGPRGLAIAGLSPSSPPPPPDQKFRLASRPLKLHQRELTYDGQPFDYLIAGSGPAGCVLAHELAKAGASVAVVEAGSLVIPGSMDTRHPPQLKFGGGAVPSRGSGIIVRNGQTVGGGSTVNVDLAFAPTLPFISSRFRRWHERHLVPKSLWTEDQIETAYEWVEEKIGTRTPATDEINRNNRVLEVGARRRGMSPRMYDLNTWADKPSYADKKTGFNQLLLTDLLSPTSKLCVLPNLEVEQVLTKSGRATGLSVSVTSAWQAQGVLPDPYDLEMGSSRRYVIPASNIILSAGSQGSAAILLRSHLGGDMVGRGVVLHPSLPLLGSFEDEINAAEGIPSTIYAVDPDDEGLIYECMSGEPEYVAYMLFQSANEIYRQLRNYRKLAGFGFLLVDEVSLDNRVKLAPNGQPIIEYSLSSQDKARMARGAAEAVKIMLAAGAKEVYLPTEEIPMPITGPGEAEELARLLKFAPGKTIVTSAHMQSTCKMGTSPQTSVVNPDYRVWEFSNLYVCDSSIFPSSVGANPMQSIYTVAKILADKLTIQYLGTTCENRKVRDE